MAEEGDELTFADAEQASPVFEKVKKTPEVEKKVIPVNEGAVISTGPYESPYAQHEMYTPPGATASVRSIKESGKWVSLWVEFESPPEMQGKVGWISRFKGKSNTKFM